MMINKNKKIVTGNKTPAINKIKKAGEVLVVIALIAGIGLAAFSLINSRQNRDVNVLGYRMFIVLSGSMNPEFDTGSVVFVRDINPENIEVGDILTFKGESRTANTTTHRVVDIHDDDGLNFTTRGDANEINDPNRLYPENVVGKVTLSVPYLGYLLKFAGSPTGRYFLIVLPCMILILAEIYKIIGYITGKNEEKSKTDKRSQSAVYYGYMTQEQSINESLAKSETDNEKNLISHTEGSTKTNREYSDGREKQASDLVYEAQKRSVDTIRQHNEYANKIKDELENKLQEKKKEEKDLDYAIEKMREKLRKKLEPYETYKEDFQHG